MKTKPTKRKKTGLRRLGDIAIGTLLLMAALLVAAEFVFGRKEKIAIENLPLFPAVFGFVVFILIVYGGIYLRKFLMRKEDYYHDH